MVEQVVTPESLALSAIDLGFQDHVRDLFAKATMSSGIGPVVDHVMTGYKLAREARFILRKKIVEESE